MTVNSLEAYSASNQVPQFSSRQFYNKGGRLSVRFHFFLFGHIAAKWLIKMNHDVQTRILLLLKLLYEQSDGTHTLTATGIVQYWAIHGIAGDRRNV